MKIAIAHVIIATVLFTAASAVAHQQVAVVPLGGTKIVSLSNFSGTWTTNTSYQTGQTIEYNGNTYVCLTSHTSDGSNTPPNATYWSLIASQGADGLSCWDLNDNGLCDGSEDINGGGCDATDCRGLADVAAPKLCLPPNYFIGIDSSGNIICNDHCDPGTIYGLDGSGNVLCRDCIGEVSGTAYIDNCNNCVGGNTGQTACTQDCNGDWGGTAYFDNCGICVEGNTGQVNCEAKKVFVSSLTYTGNLGGLSGADAICQGLADTAGLGGTYKAWLSDSIASPSTRFNHSTAPYVRVDGVRIALDWNNLISDPEGNYLEAPIWVDENGNAVMDNFEVWTNTRETGAIINELQSCSDYTSTTGLVGTGLFAEISAGWTYYRTSANCSSYNRLYCFEQ